jgi:hypothetical protein
VTLTPTPADHVTSHSDDNSSLYRSAQSRCVGWWLVCAWLLIGPGCSAFHPVRGVPASYLPDQFEGPSRGHKRTIDLGLLVQTPPDQHRVAAGDILSVYVPRVLGTQPTEVTEVGISPPINLPLTEDDPPTVGFPIRVRDDHTIALPQLPPLYIKEMTLHEVEQAIRRAYTEEHRILRPEEALVMVSLQRPRVHRVLVVRQETSDELASGGVPGTVNIGFSKRGTARTVTLKAYENDVLHALALAEGADGLPGLDAENTIYIIRRRQPGQEFPGAGPPERHALPSAPQGRFSEPMPAPPRFSQSSYQPDSDRSIRQAGFEHSLPNAASHATPNRPPGPFSNYRSGGARGPERREVATMSGSGVVQASHSFGEPVPAPAGPHHPFEIPPAQENGHSLPAAGGRHAFSPPPSFPPGTPSQPGPSQPGPPQPGPPQPGPPEAHWAQMLHQFDPTIDNPNVIKIPVRLAPGEIPRFTEEQIKLYDGDIVFIESRETEVFYTGGLLGGGQFTLPRDYDLRILEAISIAEGRTIGFGNANQAIGGVSALNQDVAVSASRLAILRMLPNGQRITIEVDLKKAMRSQEENILVQPGDMLILQYTFPEAVGAFTQRFLLEGALIGIAAGAWTGGN